MMTKVELQKLIVDAQEPDSLVEEFKKLGYSVKKEPILIGEHRVYDVVNENKTVGIEIKRKTDFESSITDKRLFIQCQKMYHLKMKSLIVLIGNTRALPEHKMKRILGAKASVLGNYIIPMVNVANDEEAAYLIARFIEKAHNPKTIPDTYNIVSAGLKKLAPQIAILASIAGIKEIIAKNILLVYPSIDLFIQALKNTPDKVICKDISKLGPEKLKVIKNALLEKVELEDLNFK